MVTARSVWWSRLWWRGHSSTRLCSAVEPPSAHWTRWWASVHCAGQGQPGRRSRRRAGPGPGAARGARPGGCVPHRGGAVAAEAMFEDLQGHGDGDVRAPPALGGQLPGVQGTAGEVDERVAVAFGRGARVRGAVGGRGGRGQRRQRGPQDRGGLPVQPAPRLEPLAAGRGQPGQHRPDHRHVVGRHRGLGDRRGGHRQRGRHVLAGHRPAGQHVAGRGEPGPSRGPGDVLGAAQQFHVGAVAGRPTQPAGLHLPDHRQHVGPGGVQRDLGPPERGQPPGRRPANGPTERHRAARSSRRRGDRAARRRSRCRRER